MTASIRPEPIRLDDPEGNPIVKVALNRQGSRHAILDAADFDGLPAGMSRAFLQNSDGKGRSYVKVPCSTAPGRLVRLSRAITGAGYGEEVRHRNGDRCDLRRRNLDIRPNCSAKRDHLAEIPKAVAA